MFATRTTHRPNRLGLSVVELAAVEVRGGGAVLLLRGVDLLDGTPVVDIKPYLPYADAIPDARAGFAAAPPAVLPVEFTAEADAQLAAIGSTHPEIKALAVQVLQQDPRPVHPREHARDPCWCARRPCSDHQSFICALRVEVSSLTSER